MRHRKLYPGADPIRTEAWCLGLPTPMSTRDALLMFVAVVAATTVLTGLWVVGWCMCLNSDR